MLGAGRSALCKTVSREHPAKGGGRTLAVPVIVADHDLSFLRRRSRRERSGF